MDKEPDCFTRFADACGRLMGNHWTFIGTVVVIIVWATSGPFLHFSTPWQLIINTSTTILTLLYVILVQNTQNRNDAAVNLKLDEIINALGDASDDIKGIETMRQRDIEKLKNDRE